MFRVPDLLYGETLGHSWVLPWLGIEPMSNDKNYNITPLIRFPMQPTEEKCFITYDQKKVDILWNDNI